MTASHNYLFVSDFHLSEGWDPATALIHRNEDFFQDVAFAQFVAHHVALARTETAVEYYQKPWRLIINGDVFDFLQVVSLPPEGDALEAVKGVRTHEELSENERKFGLGTSVKETVWKLARIAQGHALFFQALAWFVAGGNEIVILRGNHDIELHWTAVQDKVRRLLQTAYQDWRHEAAQGNDRCPLPAYDDYPEALSQESVQNGVQFYPWYYYEEGLFFVEHGCQYEPANAFTNFVDPRLPEAPEYIELPSGSLFVRYFFNEIERIHPFADNLKPISRYLFWLVRNAPSEMVSFVRDLLPQYLRATGEVRSKIGGKSGHASAPEMAGDPFEQRLLEIQEEVRAGMERASRRTSWRMIGALILLVLVLVLSLIAVRTIAIGQYWLTLASVVFAAVFFFAGVGMLQSLNNLLAHAYIFGGAIKVAGLLNGRSAPDLSSVRYHIFGHNHVADIREIPPELLRNGAPYRQWYVNTGAWVPVFSEEEKLLRPAEHLSFLRLVPSRFEQATPNADVPELLQWSTVANAPREVRLFRLETYG